MIRTTIIGASGYSGAELLRFLSHHSDVTIVQTIAASTAGRRVRDVYPALTGVHELTFEPLDSLRTNDIDLAFVALPSGEAMRVVSQIVPEVSRVIDLSGDHRLKDVTTYEEFYGRPHTSPELLEKAVYGLPELNATSIAQAHLVANPGCYPTSAILALLPALKMGLIENHGIVINSLSGVSGAGKTASQEFSFTELNENIRAYKIGTHQHTPEIESVLQLACSQPVAVSFVPHLIPITRGIYTTVHAHMKPGKELNQCRPIYEEFYRHSPFVRVRTEVPRLHDVLHTNYCDLHIQPDPRTGHLVVISAIDNLVKGAAGQAIQNMNIMFGIPEHHGLL